MANELASRDLIFPFFVLSGYSLLIGISIRRQGLPGRQRRALITYLGLTVAWVLSTSENGLPTLWPELPWAHVANYLLPGVGFAFWDFTQYFLQKPPLRLREWLAAIGALLLLLLLDLTPGVAGATPLAQEILVSLVSIGLWSLYSGVALAIAASEYARRTSPLHRNRITYLMLAALAALTGTVLLLVNIATAEITGAALYWLGAALLTYIAGQPKLRDLATEAGRAVSYTGGALVSVIIAIGLSVGVVQLLPLQLGEDFALGMIIAGLILFVFHQPLNSLTRLLFNRLIFGAGYGSQRVVREYSQAINQIMPLERLSVTSLEVIDKALGIECGALLVVEDSNEYGWQLRIVPGRNISTNQSRLTLEAGSPIADWIVHRGTPLQQYTIDVHPQFRSLDPEVRAAWHRLGMEVFVPIRRFGTLLGLIALGLRRSGQPYTDSELELLATLADQTAVALENASLFDRLEKRAEQLAQLNHIGRAITPLLDLQAVIELIALRIESTLELAAGFIFLRSENQESLQLRSTFGRQAPDVRSFRVELNEGLAGRVAATGQAAFVTNLPNDERYAPGVEGELAPDAQVALCVPIIARDKTIGVILVTDTTQANLGPTELDLLESVAAFAAIAIENSRLLTNLQKSNRELEQAYNSTLFGWSKALDLRDRETEGHTQRVTETSVRLAEEMGISEDKRVHIRRGALLHDIGKMGIPDRILLKAGELTAEEREIMRRHPAYAYDMLASISYLRPALDIPLCHHEKWDGSGYPRGLRGEMIPLAARIFAAVDVWDALRSDRPYRPGWPEYKVRQYLRDLSGTHFDPQVVAAFLKMLENGA